MYFIASSFSEWSHMRQTGSDEIDNSTAEDRTIAWISPPKAFPYRTDVVSNVEIAATGVEIPGFSGACPRSGSAPTGPWGRVETQPGGGGATAGAGPDTAGTIRTPDQRVRVFVSSTLDELGPERVAVRRAIEQLHLTPVMFELGARPHPPRELYRAYLAQSHIFVGIYWQHYGWVAPGESVSGIEDEYRLSSGMPRLLYLKTPAPDRE